MITDKFKKQVVITSTVVVAALFLHQKLVQKKLKSKIENRNIKI